MHKRFYFLCFPVIINSGSQENKTELFCSPRSDNDSPQPYRDLHPRCRSMWAQSMIHSRPVRWPRSSLCSSQNASLSACSRGLFYTRCQAHSRIAPHCLPVWSYRLLPFNIHCLLWHVIFDGTHDVIGFIFRYYAELGLSKLLKIDLQTFPLKNIRIFEPVRQKFEHIWTCYKI